MFDSEARYSYTDRAVGNLGSSASILRIGWMQADCVAEHQWS